MGILDTIKGIFTGKEKRNAFYDAMTSARGSTAGVVVSDETAMNFTAVWASCF